MLKKLLALTLCLFILTGCNSNRQDPTNKNRIYLDSKYYNKGEFITITPDELSSLENETYILYTYNSFCSFPIPCEDIFKEFMEKYNIDFLSLPFADFKETSLYETIKYAPSIIIIKNGEIISYLDAEKDEDLAKYQDASAFEKWLDEYIYFTK